MQPGDVPAADGVVGIPIMVSARDAAGNASPVATATLTIDTTKPVLGNLSTSPAFAKENDLVTVTPPAQGTPLSSSSLPAPGSARVGHAAVLLGNGKVLMAGGRTSDVGSETATAELFDPAADIFTPLGDMSVPRFEAAATILSNGRALIAGGGGSSAELFVP